MLSAGLYGQQTALKTNVVFLATTTPNAGVEIGVGRQFTIDLWGAYNAWKFPNEMKLNMYLVQPEVRYWLCRKFEGHFFGVHGHYGHFNIGQIPFISGLKNHVLRGDLYGGGLTYGYHWAFGDRWGMEAMIGASYPHFATTILRAQRQPAHISGYGFKRRACRQPHRRIIHPGFAGRQKRGCRGGIAPGYHYRQQAVSLRTQGAGAGIV